MSNGSIIGLPNPSLANNTTYGIWTLSEQFNLFRQGIWAREPVIDPYEQLTIVTNANITVTGNNTTNVAFWKISGSANWDSHAYSVQGFTAPVTLEFNKSAADSGDNGQSYTMIGLNTDPTTDANYTSLDYCAYPYQLTAYSVYHNGSSISPSVSNWSKTQKFYLTYETDGTMRHYNGSTVLYTINRGAGQTVHLDSSLYSVNAEFGGCYNVRIIKRIWNGTAYV